MRLPSGIVVIGVVLIIIIGGFLFLSFARVELGDVAVIVNPLSGTVSAVGDGASSRYFFKVPWANMIPVYVATDSIHMWTDINPDTGRTGYGDFPAIPCLTKDGLGVEVDITIRWTISPSNVLDLFRKYPGGDWKDRAIVPIVRRTTRDTLAEFTAIATIEQRDAIQVELETRLADSLAREPSLVNATVLGSIDVREIALPVTFVAAIEAKLASEQLAIAAEFNKTKILVLANATAQSAILEAEGLAQSRIIVAEATQESLSIIAGESGMTSVELTNLYLTLEALKEMAQTGKVTFLIVTGEAGSWILPLT
jgi:regulator of protease activity HflC (stomatin/prohibitin superfamily)